MPTQDEKSNEKIMAFFLRGIDIEGLGIYQ